MHPIVNCLALATCWNLAGLATAASAAPQVDSRGTITPPAAATGGAISEVGVTNSARPRIQPVGEARKLPVGTEVSIEGSVTVPSGLFSSSFGDQGFAIQDSTGGIYISVIHIGVAIDLQHRVSVAGRVAATGGLIEVSLDQGGGIGFNGEAYRVKPQWERTGKVGPANQGALIYVVGIVTEPIVPDPPYGNKLYLDDGSGKLRVFVNTSTGIDLSGIAPGQLLSVTGFSSAFETPELDPRFQTDLRQPAAH
jgi:uncharacterized protein YdeI (BOF family)